MGLGVEVSVFVKDRVRESDTVGLSVRVGLDVCVGVGVSVAVFVDVGVKGQTVARMGPRQEPLE